MKKVSGLRMRWQHENNKTGLFMQPETRAFVLRFRLFCRA